jgi:hypothetical protein
MFAFSGRTKQTLWGEASSVNTGLPKRMYHRDNNCQAEPTHDKTVVHPVFAAICPKRGGKWICFNDEG